TVDRMSEPILEPDLPIIDPHHHLWLTPPATLAALRASDVPRGAFGQILLAKPRYLFEELLADTQAGHDVHATVDVEAHAVYRAHGHDHLKTVGEIEFVSGVAAMSESGNFGDVRLCAGIVGFADLRSPHLEETLHAHIAAGGGRYRGVRQTVSHDPDPVLRT